MPITVGEYLSSDITFKVGSKGLLSVLPTDMVAVAGVEGIAISIDGKQAEWSPMEQGGFTRAMMTGKKITISMAAKRTIGDAGQEYIAGLAWLNGPACTTKFEVTFPDGDKLTGNVVVNVKKFAGGETNDPSGLEFELTFDGKPTYTPGV